LFIGSSGNPVYGNRLDGIEDVPITEEQKKNIVDEIMQNEKVLKVTDPYLSGKIFKVIITMAEQGEVEESKALSDIVLKTLTEEQKQFYDIEIYLTKYYDCTLEATGKQDEDGNFTEKVTVKFSNDLSKNEYALDYGIGTAQEVNYNKNQTIDVEEDGEFIIYGYTKDKISETVCSIQINKKTPQEEVTTQTQKITSITTRSFPIIGYKKAGVENITWTKSR
jgi:hypothetical protein